MYKQLVQRCGFCHEPTERCEEDEIYVVDEFGFGWVLCEYCYDVYEDDQEETV